jgi:hypothetical protein
MLKATMIGGATAGFVSAVPIVGALNCLCCALVIGGGFLAAFLYSKECERAGFGFRAGSGASVGLVAGLFYAISASVFGELFGFLFRLVMPQLGDPEASMEQMTEMMEQLELSPEMVDMAAQWMETMQTPLGKILVFLFNLLIAAVFSTIGGLIGGAAFKVEPAPPAPPSASAGAPPAAPPSV